MWVGRRRAENVRPAHPLDAAAPLGPRAAAYSCPSLLAAEDLGTNMRADRQTERRDARDAMGQPQAAPQRQGALLDGCAKGVCSSGRQQEFGKLD